ncbi:hypothetical protein [Pseudohaliea rubra]|uniref:Uncharacterized protein n=1 Tax=Pseudohaliea rubra DSM 19751 TaxID=1265313 RepID=A0A095VT64_9GAMM|nr:hypothetical protein [Pseudohaliea rubra]KGE04622.1 hypothetical protein HRUBRA_00781 [Pseudohaliea rubra DSM 19751]
MSLAGYVSISIARKVPDGAVLAVDIQQEQHFMVSVKPGDGGVRSRESN